jgi:hypothetical protein
MPPTFIATVLVKAKKDEVDVTKVELTNRDGKTPKDSTVKVLKVLQNQNAASCRIIILVKVPESPDPEPQNPYQLKVVATLGTEPEIDAQAFDIKVPKKVGPSIVFLNPYHPAGANYPIEGSERDYFVPFGTSSSSITSATLGGVLGTPHFDNSDPLSPIYWVEFTGLSTIPGPGGPYPLLITNAEGEFYPSTVNVADDP